MSTSWLLITFKLFDWPPIRNWFGVNAYESLTLSLALVENVYMVPSVNYLSLTILFSALFVFFTIESIALDIQELYGELDFISIFNGRFNFYLNLVGVNFFKETLSSRLALMKVLPFSLQSKFRSFLCAQNWRKAKIKQSVDKLFTNSKWATMMGRPVKSVVFGESCHWSYRSILLCDYWTKIIFFRVVECWFSNVDPKHSNYL